MKKISSVLLALLLVASLLPFGMFGVTVSAENYSGTCGENLTWTFDTSSGVLTISGSGNMEDYELGGAPWYSYKEDVKSIAFNGNITSIGDLAFFAFTNLKNIAIPDSVVSIGYGAFFNCCSLTSITVSDNSSAYHSAGNCLIETATGMLIRGCYNSVIPNDGSVTSIKEGAFSFCDSLTGIEIPDSITSIGEAAFSNCTGLTSIKIPDSVTSIGEAAFFGCISLKSIEIPNSVISIGDSAFGKCYKLVEVYNLSSLDIQKGSTDNGRIGYYALDIYTSLDEESKLFTDEEGYILYDNGSERYLIGYTGSETDLTLPADVNGNSYAINNYAFSNCNSLTSVLIPDSVISIGDWAFSDCSSLTSIKIPDSVTSIGDYAFSDCSSLTSIKIPDSVTSIGDWAFSDCSSLTSIEIPDGVTSIGGWAFYGCGSLESITIGSGVTSIGEAAFFYCSALADVYYGGSEEGRNNISIYDGNYPLLNATWHYNSSGASAPSSIGDIDGDGKISARDYQLLKRAVLKTYNLDEKQKLAGDIDGDGKISARDYQLLKRAVLGTYVIAK